MPLSALPAICYDLADGTDAAGLGPALSGGTYTSGALDNPSTAQAASPPGVSLSGDFTINVFRDIDATTLGADTDCFYLYLKTNGGAGFQVSAYADDTININLSFDNSDGQVAYVAPSLSAGYHQFTVRRTSGTAEFLIDGVPVGTPGVMGNIDLEEDLTRIINENAGAGRLSQVTIFTRSITDAEAVYLFNSGTPIPYASMSTAGGGAGARAFHLFRMMQGE